MLRKLVMMLLGAHVQRWELHPIYRVSAWLLTFVAVVVAWVLFRAESFAAAITVLRGMAGVVNGPLADSTVLWNAGLTFAGALGHCVVLGATAMLLPNSNRIGIALRERCHGSVRWTWILLGAATSFSLFVLVINAARDAVSPFIYFNF